MIKKRLALWLLLFPMRLLYRRYNEREARTLTYFFIKYKHDVVLKISIYSRKIICYDARLKILPNQSETATIITINLS